MCTGGHCSLEWSDNTAGAGGIQIGLKDIPGGGLEGQARQTQRATCRLREPWLKIKKKNT